VAANIVLLIKKIKRWHVAFGLFLLCLFLFLSIRASDEYRWSDWGFGDAQSMLSLRQWEEGGWFSNYFLFIPQGYAKVVRLFDDPHLRQHAHGTCPGSSPRVGPRLWYTHYPAGYLVPYAILFRIGLDDIFHIRMLSILFSLGAIVLMYVLFSKITGPGISFFAVIFYALSSGFLGFADTIANQPIDDLLRFGFMLAVVLSTRADSLRDRRVWMVSAWIIQFFLSLSSFDSVFFVYLWLIGWDIIERKGFRWRLYLIYALAPITAHSLQFLQNVWYLGLNDAIIDIKDTFLLKHGTDADYNLGQDRFSVILHTLHIVFAGIYKPSYLLIIVLTFYLLYYFFLARGDNPPSPPFSKGGQGGFEKGDRREMPSVLLLAVLFICGLAYIVILPHGARMPYQTRQMLPFAGLLIGGFTWSFIKGLRQGIHPAPTGSPTCHSGIPAVVFHKGGEDNSPIPPLEKGGEGGFYKFVVPYLLLSSVIIFSFWYSYLLIERKPAYFIPKEDPKTKFDEIEAHRLLAGFGPDVFRHGVNAHPLSPGHMLKGDIEFAKELKDMPTRYEPVFFDLGGFSMFWDPTYVPGYPQIMPITEYYIGSKPILCFTDTEKVVNDITYMVYISPYRFSPVIIAREQGHLEEILLRLLEKGFLIGVPPAYVVKERYVIDLSDYLRWEAYEINRNP
jgi:hypothetical protein